MIRITEYCCSRYVHCFLIQILSILSRHFEIFLFSGVLFFYVCLFFQDIFLDFFVELFLRNFLQNWTPLRSAQILGFSLSPISKLQPFPQKEDFQTSNTHTHTHSRQHWHYQWTKRIGTSIVFTQDVSSICWKMFWRRNSSRPRDPTRTPCKFCFLILLTMIPTHTHTRQRYVKGLVLRRDGKIQDSLSVFQAAACLKPETSHLSRSLCLDRVVQFRSVLSTDRTTCIRVSILEGYDSA